MSTATLTRAWTDLEFRAELGIEPDTLDHPSGDIDAELDQLAIQDATHTTWCTVISGIPPVCCC